MWRNNKIDHPAGSAEHDDWSNAAAGALWLASRAFVDRDTFFRMNRFTPERVFNKNSDWLDQGSNDGLHPVDRSIGAVRRFWDDL